MALTYFSSGTLLNRTRCLTESDKPDTSMVASVNSASISVISLDQPATVMFSGVMLIFLIS